MKTLTQEQQKLTNLLLRWIVNLEFQLKNQEYMTQLEINIAKENYEIDTKQMTQVILYQAQLMNYPEKMSEWNDTKPMEAINEITSDELMKTDYYQTLLFQILMS